MKNSGTNHHLSDTELPRAHEIHVSTSLPSSTDTEEGPSDKNVFSMSKGAVGAAIAGDKDGLVLEVNLF